MFNTVLITQQLSNSVSVSKLLAIHIFHLFSYLE
nr:MAG TPA: hypothetical protein [Caudoviricetes sp.]